jgi:hypothetical protein
VISLDGLNGTGDARQNTLTPMVPCQLVVPRISCRSDRQLVEKVPAKHLWWRVVNRIIITSARDGTCLNIIRFRSSLARPRWACDQIVKPLFSRPVIDTGPRTSPRVSGTGRSVLPLGAPSETASRRRRSVQGAAVGVGRLKLRALRHFEVIRSRGVKAARDVDRHVRSKTTPLGSIRWRLAR